MHICSIFSNRRITNYVLMMMNMMMMMADLVVKESAAETEPAWENAGTAVGLQIWRIVVSFH